MTDKREWRPKTGWDTFAIAKLIKEQEPTGRFVSQLDVDLVEAGADAILKALRDTKSLPAVKEILWGKEGEQ